MKRRKVENAMSVDISTFLGNQTKFSLELPIFSQDINRQSFAHGRFLNFQIFKLAACIRILIGGPKNQKMKSALIFLDNQSQISPKLPVSFSQSKFHTSFFYLSIEFCPTARFHAS